MNTKQKAMLGSLLALAIQAGVAIAIYFFSTTAVSYERLLVATIFAGGVVFLIGEKKHDLVLSAIVGFFALWSIVADTVFLQLLFVLAAFIAGIVTVCDARYLQKESMGKESFLALFAILAVPQLGMSAFAAKLLFF